MEELGIKGNLWCLDTEQVSQKQVTMIPSMSHHLLIDEVLKITPIFIKHKLHDLVIL